MIILGLIKLIICEIPIISKVLKESLKICINYQRIISKIRIESTTRGQFRLACFTFILTATPVGTPGTPVTDPHQEERYTAVVTQYNTLVQHYQQLQDMLQQKDQLINGKEYNSIVCSRSLQTLSLQ